MKQLSQAYFVEAKWYHENYFPTMEEYMKIALVSAGYIMITITSFVGMGEIVTKDIFEWASNNPKIVKASSIVGRLMDDIVSHTVNCVLFHTILKSAHNTYSIIINE